VTESPTPPPAIYRCRVCHSALFDDANQFEYGTGAWPNFTQPLSERVVTIRTQPVGAETGHEVRCATCGNYLGRLFSDGPGRTAERYCMETGAIRLASGLTVVTSGATSVGAHHAGVAYRR
jgi:peptide-methionine (R)-S-oxide reductase